MRKIKFCKKCNENHEEMFNGYFNWLKDDCYECPIKSCRNKLIVLDIDAEDFDIIYKISHDTAFIEAMIKLKETDPIEYQLKLSQFKNQVQQKSSEQNKNILKCPTCQATNIKKISGLSKAGSVAMWGIFSQKVKKTFHCNNCGYEW